MARIIAHLDMDAFFASVEERDHPRYKGRPLVVGADPEDGRGRGVVSTANYAARKYGIRSALPISTAWALAEEARRHGEPEVIFMSGNYDKYAEVSQKVFDIVRAYVPITEEASVDEIYFDLSFLCLTPRPCSRLRQDFGGQAGDKNFSSCNKNSVSPYFLIRANKKIRTNEIDPEIDPYKKAEALCRAIKKEIKKKEKLTCSIGIGPNKLIAKIASDRQKPDGLTVVREDEVENFISPLPIRTLPGVGPKTEKVLEMHGVVNVGDARIFSIQELTKLFGKFGSELYEKARGQNDAPILQEHEVKSVGEQETFRADTRDWGLVSKKMAQLCEEVFNRFKRTEFETFKTIVVTVRFADFETISRAHTLAEPAHDLAAFQFEAMKILMPFFDTRENPRRKAVRLIGVRVEKLI